MCIQACTRAYRLWYGLHGPGSNTGRSKRFSSSWPAFRSKHPTIQLVTVLFPWGKSGQGVKYTTPPSGTCVTNASFYTSTASACLMAWTEATCCTFIRTCITSFWLSFIPLFIYLFIHLFIHPSIHLFIRAWIHACVFSVCTGSILMLRFVKFCQPVQTLKCRTNIRLTRYTALDTHTDTHTHTDTDTHTLSHRHTHTHTHTYTHTDTQTHTHTDTHTHRERDTHTHTDNKVISKKFSAFVGR